MASLALIVFKKSIVKQLSTNTEDLREFSIFGGHLGRHLGLRKIPNDAAQCPQSNDCQRHMNEATR